MGMITGKGTSLLIGKETAWGTAATPTVKLNYVSESLQNVIDRTEEETLLGGKTSRNQDIMKKSVSGGFELIAKPKNVGLVIGATLGAEAEVTTVKEGVYKHKFTPIASSVNNDLVSLTAIVDRVVAKKAYAGLKVASVSFSCSAGDYMKMSVTVEGKSESDGSTLYTEDLDVPELKAFRFAGGSCTFDGSDFGDVTAVTVEYNNNLDDGEQTLGSGYYGTEKNPQSRDITISVDSFYNSATETVRNQKYLTENKCAIKLNFISPDEIVSGTNYSIGFDLPLVSINECSPNVSDSGKLKLSIGGKALEDASHEAITIELIDDEEDKYI